MSILTDQIKAKCATIAQNQKKVYDKGYADGKASVKHITFGIFNEYEAEPSTYCAFEGMTWREYATSDMSTTAFTIGDEKIYYFGDWLGYSADDKIVDKGIYYPLRNILNNRETFYIGGGLPFSECIESFNQGKYYIDENGYIKTLDGRMLVAGEATNDVFPERADNYPETGMFSYYITPDSDVILFRNFSEYVTKRGYTWKEHANSMYSQYSYTVESDRVIDGYGNIIQLNGVNVKPDDVIIEGANYEPAYQ